MAIALITNQVARSGFSNHGVSADASGDEVVVAAVTGKSHFITSIVIHCLSAITVTIQDNAGVPILLTQPVTFSATSAPAVFTYLNPIKVDEGKSIDVTASLAGNVNVLIQGFTE